VPISGPFEWKNQLTPNPGSFTAPPRIRGRDTRRQFGLDPLIVELDLIAQQLFAFRRVVEFGHSIIFP
jgi:hypothetical protein